MTLTKLEIQAIKALPGQYVVDGLLCCTYLDMVIAVETKLPMIMYRNGQWEDPDGKPVSSTKCAS